MAGARRRGRSEITQPRYLGRYRAVSRDCETSTRNHHFRQRPARNSLAASSRSPDEAGAAPRWAGPWVRPRPSLPARLLQRQEPLGGSRLRPTLPRPPGPALQ